MPALNIEELYQIKGEVLRSWLLESKKQTVRVTVHMGTCGISSGANEVLQAFKESLKASRRKDISVTTSGCAGICNREPLITVERAGEEPVKYAEVTGEKAREIFRKHVLDGEPVSEWVFARGWEQREMDFEGPPSKAVESIPHTRGIPFFGMQSPVVMKNRGLIQGERIEEYIARDGYFALAKALYQMSADEIIKDVKTING